MRIKPSIPSRKHGFSLVETVLSVLIMGLVFSTVLLAYTQSARRAEWSGMSLAAQAMCLRQVEQFHAAKWDTQSTPQVDQTTNIPSPVISILDLPISGTNVAWATNSCTVTNLLVCSNPITNIKMITVYTKWSFNGVSYTNSVVD